MKAEELDYFRFVVFVEDMDGDVYVDYHSAMSAVRHAFENGAKRVRINKWIGNEKQKNEKQ
jgi:hypothetical protein